MTRFEAVPHLLNEIASRLDFVILIISVSARLGITFRPSSLPSVNVLLGLVLNGFSLVRLHPVRFPEHFDSENEHNDDRRVEGIDLRDERSDTPAEHG